MVTLCCCGTTLCRVHIKLQLLSKRHLLTAHILLAHPGRCKHSTVGVTQGVCHTALTGQQCKHASYARGLPLLSYLLPRASGTVLHLTNWMEPCIDAGTGLHHHRSTLMVCGMLCVQLCSSPSPLPTSAFGFLRDPPLPGCCRCITVHYPTCGGTATSRQALR